MRIGMQRPRVPRWATTVALVGTVTSFLTVAPTPSGDAGAEEAPVITVRELSVPEDFRISVTEESEITRRGSALVRIEGADRFETTGWAVWHRGILTPLALPAESGFIDPRDMSENEHVVATHQPCLAGICAKPYVWTDGEPAPILTEGFGWAFAVNDHGQALASRVPDLGQPFPETFEATVVWDDGRIVTAPPYDARTWTFPVDINNHGQVALTIEEPFGRDESHAGIWEIGDPRVEDLGTLPGYDGVPVDMNDRGDIAGRVETEDGTTWHAVLWRGGDLIELGDLGGGWSAAEAINERGEVLGHSTTADGETHSFLWRRGRLIDLGPLDATALSNRGQVVGAGPSEVPGVRHALFWQDGRVIDLGALADPQKPSFAYDINDRGQVLGEVDGRPVIWTIRSGRSGEAS